MTYFCREIEKTIDALVAPFWREPDAVKPLPAEPLVSILIPNYNNTHLLPGLLCALCAQSYANWEALVVDDCSTTDDIEEVVAAANDPRIRLLRHKTNLGAATARNTAFAASTGEYVLYMDPDDLVHPQWLSLIMDKILSDPSIDVVIYDMVTFEGEHAYHAGELKTERDMTIWQWIMGQALMRREIWIRAGGQCADPILRHGNQDWDFWLSAMRAPLKVAHVARPLFLYRIHPLSTSSSRAEHESALRLFLYARHKELFDRHGTGPAFIAEGYAMSCVALLEKRDWGGAWRCLREGLDRCGACALSRHIVRQSKAALLRTAVGRALHPVLRAGKRIVQRCLERVRDGVSALAYKTQLGRRFFWRGHAHHLYKTYGHLQGGYETLREALEHVRPMRIFEIGCGNGRNFPLYAECGVKEIVGQDISSSALEYARSRGIPGVTLHGCMVEELPYPDGYFDLVVSNRVLQHVPKDTIESTFISVANLGFYLYCNEITDEELQQSCGSAGKTDFYMFLHDYPALFEKAALTVVWEKVIDGERRVLARRNSRPTGSV